MAKRRRSTGFSLAMKSAEILGAAPQVMNHRLARMAVARIPMDERDRKEFVRMVAEKPLAFLEACQGIAMGMLAVNRAVTASLFGGRPPHLPRLQREQLRLLEQAISPVHRKVTANARRLAKTKAR